MIESLWAFMAVSVFVIVTPGPDTLVTARNALIAGRGAGIATAAGVAAGQLIWVIATSLGLVALLLASEQMFFAVRLLGAAYLVWLGVQSIVHAWRASAPAAVAGFDRAGLRLTRSQAFRHGLLSDLGNPKMAVFFASILPQFASPGAGLLSSLVMFGLVFVAMAFIWLAGYSVAIAAAGARLRPSNVWRILESAAGGVLIVLGLRLATEQR